MRRIPPVASRRRKLPPSRLKRLWLKLAQGRLAILSLVTRRLWRKPNSPILRRQVFFQRRGRALPVSADPADYRPGDLVTQTLPGNLPHIAIVSDARSAEGKRPLVIHNVGAGARREDTLFAWPPPGAIASARSRATSEPQPSG